MTQPLDTLDATLQRELAKTAPGRPQVCTGILDGNHADWARGDLAQARDAGIVAIIAKASQGKDWRDRSFEPTVALALELGLLVGAYHFGSATAPGEVQAEWFLASVAAVRGPLLLALDWETNPQAQHGTMTPEGARAFVARVHELTGRWPLLYSGASFLREHLGRARDEVLGRCPLWLAAYGPDPLRLQPQATWECWTLQQYTNGGAGPADQGRYPRKTPGFGRDGAPGGCDRSVFRGSAEELRAWWTSPAVGGGP